MSVLGLLVNPMGESLASSHTMATLEVRWPTSCCFVS